MGVQIPQWEMTFFGGCPGHSKASAIFAAAVAAARWLQKRSFNHQYRHAAEGIIQYARQVQIEMRKIWGPRRWSLSARKGMMGVDSVGEV